MKNIFVLLLGVLLSHLAFIPPTQAESDPPQDYEELVAEGRRQFARIQAYNAQNIAEGHPEDNWYIFSFMPEMDWFELCRGAKSQLSSSWINDPSPLISDLTFVNNLNAEIAAFNDLNNEDNPRDIQMYINLSDGWKWYVPASITADVGSNSNTSDIVTYLKTKGEESRDWAASLDQYQDEIKARFQRLCSDIINAPPGASGGTPFEIPINGNRVVFNLTRYQMLVRDGEGDPSSTTVEKKVGRRSIASLYFARGSYFEACKESFDFYLNMLDRTPNGTTEMERKVEHQFYSIRNFVESGQCGRPNDCTALMESYRQQTHPYLQGKTPLRKANEDNPCLLATMQHYEFIDLPPSEWMEQLKNLCAWMLGPALAIPAMATALPALLETIASQATLRCATGAGVDALFQAGFHYYFPEGGTVIEWSEAFEKIRWSTAVVSCLENTINLQKAGAAALLSSSLSCVADGLTFDGSKWHGVAVPTGFDGFNCAKGALSAAIAQGLFQSGSWAFNKLRSMPIENFLNGLGRLGIAEESFAAIFKIFRNVDSAPALASFLKISEDQATLLINNPQIRNGMLNNGAFIAKLRNLGLDAADRGKLIDDLLDPVNGQALRNALYSETSGNPALLSAWRAAINTDPEIRLNIGDLEIIEEYIQRTGKSADEVFSEIPTSTTLDGKKWLGDRRIEPFLNTNPIITNLPDPPPGYSFVTQSDGSRYIRRVDANDPYTPRLMVNSEGQVVRYIKPERLASNALLRNRLRTANGGTIPDNHQAHHIVPSNVAENSTLHQEAISRNLYDVDRVSNGRLLAETAEDFAPISQGLPTHYGSHPNYDDAVNQAIDDVLAANNVLPSQVGGLSDSQISAIIDDIEAASIDILENWGPSKLN